MNKSNTLFLLIVCVAYALLWWLMAPYLGYLLDSDGVAYLTIARRVVEGDFQQSINGLWSPLNSWLLVPFMKAGWNAWELAKFVNFSIGIVVIGLVNQLNKRFIDDVNIQRWMLLPLPIVLTYFSYFQLFGDLLQLIFVLAYLCVLYRKKFQFQTKDLVLAGIFMGFGFYAKAYSFIFLILHSIVFYGIHFWNSTINKQQLFKAVSITIGVCFFMMMPWIYLLYEKYHIWSLTGLAGKLNMSWYIWSHKTFRTDIHLLIPPTYEDSPSFWEDPYPSQGILSSPFSSLVCFGRWLLRVGHTILMAAKCYSQLTLFSIPFITWAIYHLFKQKSLLHNWQTELHLLLTILVLPLGYLMMHIETRYIWLNVFLLLILITRFLQKKLPIHSSMFKGVLMVILISITVFPLTELWSLPYKNKDLFELAEQLNKQQIKGKFVSDAEDEGRMWVVAYLSGTSNYTIENDKFSLEELLPELKRYNIDFYIAERNQTMKYDANPTFRAWFPKKQQLSSGQLLYWR